MAGTVTVTMTNAFADGVDPNVITIDWLSAVGGAASGDIASLFAAAQSEYGIKPKSIKGRIMKIETIPGLLGDKSTTCPSAAYDIVLNDPYGLDIAGGMLADRSNTAAEVVAPTYDLWVDSEISLSITSAGDAKTGRILITLA